MNRTLFFIFAALITITACNQPAHNSTTDTDQALRPSPIPLPQAVFPDGFTVDLELALTSEEISRGLMFRPSLPENRGMLFLFDQPRLPTFWMKNTLISLDLVYLDGTGAVVDVIADVQPCAADPCPNFPPSRPAQAVLEIGAGVAAAHSLEVGSTITFDRVSGYPGPNEEAEPAD